MKEWFEYEQFIIWGANMPDVSVNGRAIENVLNVLKKKEMDNRILFIVDSNQALWGKTRLGYDIVSPGNILEYPEALIIINCTSICEIEEAIKAMKAPNDYRIVPHYFYCGTVDIIYDNAVAKKDLLLHKEEIKKLYDMQDNITCRYLDIIFKLRERNEDDFYSSDFYQGTGKKINYFCDQDLAPKGEVSYIDVGAYVGDSIEPIRKFFGTQLKKIIAFEPDPESEEKLKDYIVDYGLEKITEVFPYALGDDNRKVRFIKGGLAGQISSNGESVIEQRRFDDMRFEIIGDAMVKMDIEGSEMSALKGMRDFIKKEKPYLAICIYHRVEDLYQIANYIKTLVPEYKLYIRGGWHLECWAVPR